MWSVRYAYWEHRLIGSSHLPPVENTRAVATPILEKPEDSKQTLPRLHDDSETCHHFTMCLAGSSQICCALSLK